MAGAVECAHEIPPCTTIQLATHHRPGDADVGTEGEELAAVNGALVHTGGQQFPAGGGADDVWPRFGGSIVVGIDVPEAGIVVVSFGCRDVGGGHRKGEHTIALTGGGDGGTGIVVGDIDGVETVAAEGHGEAGFHVVGRVVEPCGSGGDGDITGGDGGIDAYGGIVAGDVASAAGRPIAADVAGIVDAVYPAVVVVVVP